MSSKKRFFWFVGIVFLLAVVSYQLAIARTLSLRKEYNASKADSNLKGGILKQLQVLSQKQVYYDSILTKLNLTDTSLENDLLRILNTESEILGTKVKAFNAPHVSTLENSKIVTYNFILEGNFINLIKLIHTIEKNGTYGEINHLNFKKQKDFRSRRTILTVEVFIQNIQ